MPASAAEGGWSLTQERPAAAQPVFPHSDYVDVAVDLATGVEVDAVVDGVVAQIQIVGNHLQSLGLAPSPSNSAPDVCGS